ncbi:FUSC family membrane protein [Rhodoblastus sp.]|uniref:FUSC family protein n=1 Tax=Rhodoblastus sp. TaxID=1962975 RepID=UPI0035B25CC6
MRVKPKLLKYLFGHHVLNGLVVALGVLLVGLIGTAAFGFLPGMAAASGALCVSIADTSTPFAAKLRILPLAWLCASAAALATALAGGTPLVEGAVVVLTGFVAGLLIALGRWAIPLSVLTLLAMVFTLGAPAADAAERLHYALMSALGGALYTPIALALTRVTDTSGRRITLAEVLREFAAYLRRVAGFYRKDADEGEVCLKVVEHQASFADHLQTARSLIVSAADRAEAMRLIAALAAVLEAFDGIVSTLADHAPLRLAQSGGCETLAAQMEQFLMRLADDLDALALDLIVGADRLSFPDREPALDAFSQQIAKLEADYGADPQVLRAARLTRARVGLAVSHLARLPDLVNSQQLAEQALAGVDISAFAPPLRVSMRAIADQLRWSSPIFRHALRLALALGFGYLLIELVPGLKHGNWILLTIAVIMRAGYSATRQRRDQRLVGSVLGCGLAGALLWIGSPSLLLAVQLLSVAVAHAYVKVDYRLTSIAASVMALLGLHLIDPVQAAPVGARLVDTLIGAGVAFLFNFLLPQWESQSAPRVALGFLRALHRYADRALRWDAPEQDYRLARKNLMEAFSALGESAGRMRADPEAKRDLWPEYSKLIAAAYVAAAQIVTVRLLLRNRRSDLDPLASQALLEQTRRAAMAELDFSTPCPERPPSDGAHEDNALAALRQRCDEVLREARALRLLAEADFALAERRAA